MRVRGPAPFRPSTSTKGKRYLPVSSPNALSTLSSMIGSVSASPGRAAAAVRPEPNFEWPVREAADRHGLSSPAELLYALLRLLGEQHRASVLTGGQGYADGPDTPMSGRARSPAESLRDWAQVGLSIQDHNTRAYEGAGLYSQARSTDRYARGLQALVEVLDLY